MREIHRPSSAHLGPVRMELTGLVVVLLVAADAVAVAVLRRRWISRARAAERERLRTAFDGLLEHAGYRNR